MLILYCRYLQREVNGLKEMHEDQNMGKILIIIYINEIAAICHIIMTTTSINNLLELIYFSELYLLDYLTSKEC